MGPSVRVHVHVDLVLEPASPWHLVLEHVSTGLSRGSFCCLVTKVETNEEGIFFFICIYISAASGLSCGVWDLVP